MRINGNTLGAQTRRKQFLHLMPEPVENAKWITLTRGKFALVDEVDFELACRYTWTLKDHGRVFYAFTTGPVINGKRTNTLLHRLLLNAEQGVQVDHINGDGLDCRRENLRLCTHKENHRNLPKFNKPNSTSRFKGVRRAYKKWEAIICVNAKTVRVGLFLTEEDAALAYNEAARKYFGDYARMNAL